MNAYRRFKQECQAEIAAQGADSDLAALSRAWLTAANAKKYSYHFEWLGRPIIQYPQDVFAMQELIWSVKPDLVVETGIAHGGSLIFTASMLELNAACGGPIGARALGIDVDIRSHNLEAINAHPMSKRIDMIEGSSIDAEVIKQVHVQAAGKKRVLIVLDSNHTHDHVLAELQAYADLTSVGSYCVVFDTVIDDLPKDMFPNRDWGPGNNPKTAVAEFLRTNSDFEIDTSIDHKLLVSVAPRGYLKRVTRS